MLNTQLEAQLFLQEHGIMVDSKDHRSDLEIAQSFGHLAAETAGVEIEQPEV